jgi:GNAT superfamily N-acetyltransferase
VGDLVIRPVTAADLDRLAALQEASILRLGTPVYGAEKARAWARMGWEFKHALIGEGAFFTAERAGSSLGVGGWSPDSRDPQLAWIRYLFVDPDHVRQGIGRRLVARAEDSAIAAGRTRFDVWSSRNAEVFYAALGYRRIRPARWPVQGGLEIDNVLMSKRWPASYACRAAGRSGSIWPSRAAMRSLQCSWPTLSAIRSWRISMPRCARPRCSPCTGRV